MTVSARTASRRATWVSLLFAIAAPAFAQDHSNLIEQSSTIFVGRVTQIGGSTMPTVPPSPDMAVVEVERILDKPPAVSMQTSTLVTVKLKQSGSLRLGDRVIFYTNGRIFGEGLAVEEVGHETMAQATPGATSGGGPADRSSSQDIAQIRQQQAEASLQERIRAAPVVVVGRVREVHDAAGAALQQSAGGGLRITEHDPRMAEAVIEVTDAFKGATAGSDVVVRFPTSEDVMWFNYPKLRVGEAGVFILQPDSLAGGSKASIRGTEVPAYNVPQRNDVLPVTEADRVRKLVP